MPDPTYVLGVNSAYHESAACLVADGRVLAAAEEERFTRIKHAKPARVDNPHQLPVHAIAHCLETAGIPPDRVSAIAYSLNPRRRLSNLTLGGEVVAGSWGSLEGERTFHRNLLRVPGRLRDLGFAARFHWVDHHRAHAASAFYPSPHPAAAVLTLDGIGESTSTAFAHGEGTRLRILREIDYPRSLGFLWEKLCGFVGFGEYDACKLMGLASYGDPTRFRTAFRGLAWPTGDGDGSFGVDAARLELRGSGFAGLEAAFDIPRRRTDEDLDDVHADLAAALQETTNEIVADAAAWLQRETGARSLCLAGGVALNCVSNAFAFERSGFEELWIQPAAHDAGTALGAALEVSHAVHGASRGAPLRHVYLGPRATPDLIERALRKHQLRHERLDDIEGAVAERLATGAVVGWVQGAMELGPRALGNRSLLGDPRDPAIRDRLNREIKRREGFRPFAPSVLAEKAAEWFELGRPTPATDFMLLALPLRAERRAQVPGVAHVDGTSRIQTVKRAANPRFHRLLSAFEARTGVPMLLNTSFNDHEPIVCTPEDALETFVRSGIDFLAMGDHLVSRKELSTASRKRGASR